MGRRQILAAGGPALGIPTFLRLAGRSPAGDRAATETFAVTKGEAAWRARLGSAGCAVPRQHGTERTGSSSLVAETIPAPSAPTAPPPRGFATA